MIIGNILCRHSGLDPESSDFLRKPLDSCFRRNDTSVWLTKEHKKSPSLLPLPSREGNLKFSLAPWGIGVNLRRKIMDLIIKSPSFPLFQRGMFYDSPLWQRGVRGDFTDNFFTFFLYDYRGCCTNPKIVDT